MIAAFLYLVDICCRVYPSRLIGPRRRLLVRIITLACIAASIGAIPSFAAAVHPQTDYTRNVDPFIGVDWGGNTFVGSAIPYGMVKVGPDMETFDGRKSGVGYSSYGVIVGFSHLQL